MSLPSYPEYKDSGVAWLGRVPNHWDIQRFKWLIERNDGGVWGDDPDGDDDTIVLRSTEQTVDGRWQIDEPAKRKLTERDRLSALLEVGDLLLTKSSGSALHIGKTTLVDKDVASLGACYSNFMQRLRVKSDFCPKLAWYILNNGLARVQLDLLSNSTTGLANLNGTIIGELLLAQPPQEEQTAITSFLDRETGKIDALIAEQERLLTLLAEKRQATISHAVTKGLNPDAPMKDSGVAWLGEVPEHWGHSKKLLDLVTSHRHAFVNGPFGSDLLTSELVSEGVPVVYIRDIKESGYIRVSEWCVTKEKATQLEFCNVIPGDLVVAKVGDPPGLTAIYPEGEPEGIVTQDVIRLRLDSAKSHSGYIRWLLNSKYGQTAIDQISVESTRTRVGLGEYKQLRFFIPPLEEQRAISDFLDNEMGRLNALAAEASRAVDLLKERRSALIAAAVTGQIDVRGLVTEPEAA